MTAKLYTITATGAQAKEAEENFNKEIENIESKLKQEGAKPLPEAKQTLYHITCDLLLPEGVTGPMRGEKDSEESFEAAELEAATALKYNFNVTQYKVVASYKLTKKQKTALVEKRPPTAFGDLEGEVDRYSFSRF